MSKASTLMVAPHAVLPAPARRFVGLLWRSAATLSLVMVIYGAVLPSSGFNGRPLARLGFIVTWAALMSVATVIMARSSSRVRGTAP